MKQSSISDIAKIRRLMTVLQKCNGKAVIGNSEALISPMAAKILVYCGIGLLTVCAFAAAYFLQPRAAQFLGAEALTSVLMLGLFCVSFVLAFKDTVTVLYMADDLEPLLPMPFSAAQIVTAKLAIVSVFPFFLSIAVLNSIGLGYGIREGAGLPFILGTVLSSILIPITGISAAALLVVILFRVFGFIRNRDVTVALGGLFTFGLLFVRIFLTRSGSGDADKVSSAFGTISSISDAFPNIGFMKRFMFEGELSGLLLCLVISAAVVGLALLAVRTFYLDTALSMQNTGTKSKPVTAEVLRSGRKRSLLQTLTRYEAHSARRNPAYLIYGFVITLAWPVLFLLPLVMGDNLLKRMQLPLDTVPALIVFMTFAAAASCFACGYNILPSTAFSREGANFSMIQSFPVDLTEYCRSKRNVSMRICSLGSVVYIVLLGIVCLITKVIALQSFWTILAAALLSFCLDLIFVDLMLLKNAEKPNFNWDSETELSRKLGAVNLVIGLIGFVLFMLTFVFAALVPRLQSSGIMTAAVVVCIAVLLVGIAAALGFDRYAIRKTAESLSHLE